MAAAGETREIVLRIAVISARDDWTRGRGRTRQLPAAFPVAPSLPRVTHSRVILGLSTAPEGGRVVRYALLQGYAYNFSKFLELNYEDFAVCSYAEAASIAVR
jgi:hypothetical protein